MKCQVTKVTGHHLVTKQLMKEHDEAWLKQLIVAVLATVVKVEKLKPVQKLP